MQKQLDASSGSGQSRWPTLFKEWILTLAARLTSDVRARTLYDHAPMLARFGYNLEARDLALEIDGELRQFCLLRIGREALLSSGSEAQRREVIAALEGHMPALSASSRGSYREEFACLLMDMGQGDQAAAQISQISSLEVQAALYCRLVGIVDPPNGPKYLEKAIGCATRVLDDEDRECSLVLTAKAAAQIGRIAEVKQLLGQAPPTENRRKDEADVALILAESGHTELAETEILALNDRVSTIQSRSTLDAVHCQLVLAETVCQLFESAEKRIKLISVPVPGLRIRIEQASVCTARGWRERARDAVVRVHQAVIDAADDPALVALVRVAEQLDLHEVVRLALLAEGGSMWARNRIPLILDLALRGHRLGAHSEAIIDMELASTAAASITEDYDRAFRLQEVAAAYLELGEWSLARRILQTVTLSAVASDAGFRIVITVGIFQAYAKANRAPTEQELDWLKQNLVVGE